MSKQLGYFGRTLSVMDTNTINQLRQYNIDIREALKRVTLEDFIQHYKAREQTYSPKDNNTESKV